MEYEYSLIEKIVLISSLIYLSFLLFDILYYSFFKGMDVFKYLKWKMKKKDLDDDK